MKAYDIYEGRLWQGARPKKPGSAIFLQELGVGLVVNLWTSPFPEVAGQFAYIHQPTPDGKNFDKDALLDLAARVANVMNEHGVYVHCNAGRNRSGLVCALTMRELTGMSGRQAMEHVRLRRPRAIANPYFAAWLEELP